MKKKNVKIENLEIKTEKVKKKLSKKQKIIVGVASIIIIGGGSFGAISMSKYNKEMKIIENTVELYPIAGSEKIYMSGMVAPLSSKELFVGPEQGELSDIKVSNGQIVQKGTPLFTCKNTTQINEISELNEQIATKKKEKQNAIDEESKIAIEAEIKELNRQVAKLNKTAYSTIYAPFGGKIYISGKTSSQEQSGPVMTIESTDFYIKAQVNEIDSYKIHLEQEVEITALATKDKYKGNIVEIGDRPVSADEIDLSTNINDNGMTKYGIKINLETQENLKNGLHIQGIALYESEGVKVPSSAIEKEGSKNYVFKYENGKAVKTEVKISEEKDEFIILSSGVVENDTIVKDLSGKILEDGQEIYSNFR